MKKLFSIIIVLWYIFLPLAANNSVEVFDFYEWNDELSFYLYEDYTNLGVAIFTDETRAEIDMIICDKSEFKELQKLAYESKLLAKSITKESEYNSKNIYQQIIKKFETFAPVIKDDLISSGYYGLMRLRIFITKTLYNKYKSLFDGESTEDLYNRLKKNKSLTGMTISVFTMQKGEQPPIDNKIYKWIETKFDIKFDWDILIGDKYQKIGVLIASGELPDLVEVDSDKFQNAGCLRDLKPLIEKYAPNLFKHYSSVWKQMIYQDSEKDNNGNIIAEHIYSLPNYGVYDGVPSDTYYNTSAWWIQKAVLKEFGYPVIKTIDQYFDILEAYYKKYPTIDGMPTIPFSIITADWEIFNLWNPPNFLAGYPNEGNGHVEYKNGKYIYQDNFTDENAKRWFKLANGYFKRGLIDPASFTDNREQYYAKISQGRVLGMFIQGWEFFGDNAENALWSNGKDERTYAPLAITFDESIRPHYRDQELPNLQRGYGITIKCPYDKAIKIIQFMDKMLEEENQKILYWGFEGEDYYIDKDGSVTGTKGAAYRTYQQKINQKSNSWIHNNRATLWAEEAPRLEGRMPSGYTRSMDDLPWEYEWFQKQVDLDLWAAYEVSSYPELVDPNPPKNAGWYPMWQCNPDAENGGFEEEAAIAMCGFETIQRKYLPKMIMGNPVDFDETWDEYCSLLKPLTEVYNTFMQQKLDLRVKLFVEQ